MTTPPAARRLAFHAFTYLCCVLAGYVLGSYLAQCDEHAQAIAAGVGRWVQDPVMGAVFVYGVAR